MKKYGLVAALLFTGAIGLTSCSSKESSVVAYEQQAVAVTSTAQPTLTDNTAPTPADNQAETQNLQTGTTSKEETASTENAKARTIEDATRATDQPKASNKANKTPVAATKAPVKTPAVTKSPSYIVATKCPQYTKKPAVTVKPQSTAKPQVTATAVATQKPVATKRPVATKWPVATKKPVATKIPSSDSSNSGTSNSSYASKVLDLINEQRQANGLQALTTTSALQKAATKRAQEIVSTFSHTRPDGTSGVTVLKDYSISYNAWGENIAYGQRTPAAVMDSWMNSSGHRANILSSKFGKVGIGCYEQNGTLYWTQVFTN